MVSKLTNIGILLLLLTMGCSENSLQPIKEVEVEIDVRLPIEDGFYRLEIDTTKHQTLHRIDGDINPNIQYKRIEWMSNLSWMDRGEYVPTINERSYTDSNGTFSTMIAPIKTMRGDTMMVGIMWDDKDTSDSINDFTITNTQTIYIILE